MPNFTPTGKIYIGHVPFDNSYRHTMTFASTTAQQTYFASVCTAALSGTDYTYVRMNNAIRVPFNAESLYTYNYVMYQNSNYGSKWFYAFIVGINYVNENMTELVLELDVMQTWYFDYTLKQCFVEREHVNNDTVGLHLNPEPYMDVQYIRENYYQNVSNAAYIVVLVNQLMRYKPLLTVPPSYKADSSYPVSGGRYQNYFSGCKPIIFYNNANGVAAFKRFLDDLNLVGAADTITDVFTVPSQAFHDEVGDTDLTGLVVELISDDPNNQTWTLPDVYTLVDNARAMAYDINILRPNVLNQYLPRNNKLLTYPYTFLEFGDFSGRKQDYRWEYFDNTTFIGDDEYVHVTNKLNGISDNVGYITPYDYNGVAFGVQPVDKVNPEPFTYNFSNKISWTYGVYDNWAAQHSLGNQLAVLGGVAAIAVGTVSGISQLASTSKVPKHAAGKHSSGTAHGEFGASNMHMIAGGAAAIGSTIANIDRMHRTPDEARGNTQGNSKFQTGYAGYYYCAVNLRYEFAEIIDGFFDMYGYQVDVVKVPNREGRTSWNYVKTANACHYGNVPADMMAQINSIYDAGITFWHTSDVGNYSLSNAIVTP